MSDAVPAAPLVPVEVDLRGLPFMPLDVVRLLDSDLFALTSGDEFKAALSCGAKPGCRSRPLRFRTMIGCSLIFQGPVRVGGR